MLGWSERVLVWQLKAVHASLLALLPRLPRWSLRFELRVLVTQRPVMCGRWRRLHWKAYVLEGELLVLELLLRMSSELHVHQPVMACEQQRLPV